MKLQGDDHSLQSAAMNAEDGRINRQLSFAVLGSFILCAAAVILRVGLEATPYTTTDSLGRTMGFNDPLDAEHFRIMISNFDPAKLLALEYQYEWLLATAHVIGAGLLLMSTRVSSRIVRWFFAAQELVFPFGILALLIFPLVLFGLLTGKTDRESFVDVPFIIMVAHPIWVLTSLYITFALRGEGLGLSRVWSGLTRCWKTGARSFVKAVR